MDTTYETNLLREFNNFLSERKYEAAHQFIITHNDLQSMKLLNNFGWFYMNIGTAGAAENSLWYKRYDKAEECFRKGIRFASEQNSHFIYSNYGEALMNLGKYREAQNILLKSTEFSESIVNQNNLSCCLYHNSLYAEAEKQMEKAVTKIQRINVFELINKLRFSLNNMSIFIILYNLACIKSKLNKIDDIKIILNVLLNYQNCHLIDIDDIDIMDILCIAYMCKEYSTVVRLFPKSNYAIDEICFGIYVSSMLHIDQSPESFYNGVTEDYREELSNMRSESAKKELEDRLKKIEEVYESLMFNNNSAFNIFPRPIKGNYLFFE